MVIIMDKLIQEKAKELVAQMTLEEKAGLCSGKDSWWLKSIARLGLEPIMVADGPHGLRKQIGGDDILGIGESVPAVCFPTASALACSFDRDLVYQVGKALGEECLQEQVSVILGPGVNMKRSPLCGRNFEYFSEDPVLSGELAVGMINGVQSKGIGTSLKHFAVNNQERLRMTVSAVIDERTLRETYLKAFEIAVKKAKPWTIMCAYNRINGEYCSENSYLLSEILRAEWGFEGLVVSDWGAVSDRALGVKAGLDLEMPGCQGINDKKIVAAVTNKMLTEQELDLSACHVTELILQGMKNKQNNFNYDLEVHHDLAVKAAEESAVLLKNEEKILPGNLGQRAAVIGTFAKTPRYQGAGSSKIHPTKVDNAWEALTSCGLDAEYSQGYLIKPDQAIDEEKLISDACKVAKGKDIVYLFAGLPEGYESEGFDRTDITMPEYQNRLIEEVVKVNSNVVVILIGGAPIQLPWVDMVKGILLCYLAGEGGGRAVANLLLGNAVPCGKLAETWPLNLSDVPSVKYFPGGRNTVEYRESIFTGYRYYDTADKPVQFPFGHGLSYTNFIYSDLRVDRAECNYGDKITIHFSITNNGEVAAKETALIFVSHRNEKVFLPKKELKEFTKILLQPGETKQIARELDTKDFGYYNTIISDWYAESGEYTIIVAASCSNCRLEKTVEIHSKDQPQPDLRSTAPTYYHLSNQKFEINDKEFCALYGKPLPISDSIACRPFDAGNNLLDVQSTVTGKLFKKIAGNMTKKVTQSSEEEEGMMINMMQEMPFHSLVTTGEGMISEKMMDGLLDLMNGHYGKGIVKIIKKQK
ncbi:MAG: glycoside hydrolase family 3 C-terminal domain-containing protein [Mobilitalea sp.]